MTETHKPIDRLVVGLDFPTAKDALALVDTVGDVVQWYKIGFELFMAEGPDIVRAVRDKGKNVFLDLKFHDIPNTVGNAARVISQLGVSIFNVHTQGGTEMMRAALEAAADGAAQAGHSTPMVYGVTMLTSINDATAAAIGYDRTASHQAIHLAQLAESAGLQGVVASPQEILGIRETCGREFGVLTPGIRPAGSAQQDQQRVATPRSAVEDGATYLVVSRPVRQATDPRAAAQAILTEMEGASQV